LRIALGAPGEREAREHSAVVGAWLRAWVEWRGPGKIEWAERRWPGLGTQRLPLRLVLGEPIEVAEWIGERASWERAGARRDVLVARWPPLAADIERHLDTLAGQDEGDFRRLLAMLEWLAAHPRSGLYSRQLPVPGLDSKWLERRAGLVGDLIARILGHTGDGDLYAVAGLRREPRLMRVRILDPTLRERVGGIEDLAASAGQIASLALPVRHVYIVENVRTGLAFTGIEGAVVVMGLGYAVDVLDGIDWLHKAPCTYWGDIDTHGFVILDRLRRYLPGARSMLMDEDTLVAHRELWSEESRPAAVTELARLTPREQRLYHDLRGHRFGPRVRLEQERIAWDYAWARLAPQPGIDGVAP